ncbi:GDSL-type esterase/lipase family protein [Paenibacillus ginsengarvi]|uniref:SGNH hydrolase-type esterase domain-containing protein n=1 Tax=Paenibacillus ginsengarvi TaxID=400777 RepID=A0A3B0CD99_9BACL|nr:GDSL-type esterase/lipase family protein [Paenibacillus ginsengarvi]RKN84175.1 hypothetical protein D7M11_14285 [Paenibacillus ginsengarvi]
MKRELYYLAVGDSLTAGKGVVYENSFVSQYVRLTESGLGRKVLAENAGVSGETTGQILQRLTADTSLRKAVAASDMLTLTAGGNDLILAAKRFAADSDTRHLMSALKLFGRNMSRIMEEIEQLKKESGSYAVKVIGLYNPLPEFEEAIFWVDRFNQRLRSFHSGSISVVDVYDLFLGREDDLLSEDRIHPNTEGYRLIAERVYRGG